MKIKNKYFQFKCTDTRFPVTHTHAHNVNWLTDIWKDWCCYKHKTPPSTHITIQDRTHCLKSLTCPQCIHTGPFCVPFIVCYNVMKLIFLQRHIPVGWSFNSAGKKWRRKYTQSPNCSSFSSRNNNKTWISKLVFMT